MKMRTIVLAAFLAFGITAVNAQNEQPGSGFIVAKAFRVTKPLRDMPGVNETKLQKAEQKESKDRSRRQPQYFEFTGADGMPYGNESTSLQTKPGSIPAGQLKANFAGQSSGGSRPFDPSGAAGPNHYVQMINATTMRVYNKTTGSTIGSAISLGTIWNPDTQNNGDPIVMYDKAADRWFLAQFGSFFNNEIYIAISTTGDPLGSYYTYTFESPSFPDYLKFSVWQDGYYMTANTNTQRVFAFERDAMIAGTPGARSVFASFNPPDGGGFFVPLTGCASDGTLPAAGTPCPIFSYSDNGWGGGNQDRVNIYNMTVNWTSNTPTASITTANNVTTAAFDASYNNNWDDVSQPGTTQKLDGIGGVCMFRAQWKTWEGYNSVVLNWAVRISNSQRSLKWCELRQDQSTGTWSMYQEGIHTPDGDTRWMGSMVMDDNGSIGLSYMKANATTSIFPSLYFTGRRVCDPLGELPVTEVLVVEGGGSQTGTNRNGDYAHGVLDPDGVTIWSTSEYMGGNTGGSAARTRIFSYQIESCLAAGISIDIISGSNPACIGNAITFAASPENGGTAPMYQWMLNGTALAETSDSLILENLVAGDIITCQVTSNEVGIEGTTALSNEIVMEVVSELNPSIAITASDTVLCVGDVVTFSANATNAGNAPTYQWYVNGAASESTEALTLTINESQTIACGVTSSLSCATAGEVVSTNIDLVPAPLTTPSISMVVTSTTIIAGESVTFTATAENVGPNPTYRWYINGIWVNSASGPTYTTSTIGNGQSVTCEVTSSAPCNTTPTAETAPIAITVEPNAIQWNEPTELLSIYPNPSFGEVTFVGAHSGTFYIVNEAGQLVQEITLNNSNNNRVQLNNLAAGTYVVSGQNDYGIVKQRLVVVK
jgi:hypothetical protein